MSRGEHRARKRPNVDRTALVLMLVAVAALLLSAGHLYTLIALWQEHSLRLVVGSSVGFGAGGLLAVGAQFAHMMWWRRPVAIGLLAAAVLGLLVPVAALWSGH